MIEVSGKALAAGITTPSAAARPPEPTASALSLTSETPNGSNDGSNGSGLLMMPPCSSRIDTVTYPAQCLATVSFVNTELNERTANLASGLDLLRLNQCPQRTIGEPDLHFGCLLGGQLELAWIIVLPVAQRG